MSLILKKPINQEKILDESAQVLKDLSLFNQSQVQVKLKALQILNFSCVALFLVLVLASLIAPDADAAPSITAAVTALLTLVCLTLYFHLKKNISSNDGFIIATICTLIYAITLWFNGVYPVYLFPIVALLVTLFTSPNKSLILNSTMLILACFVLFNANSVTPTTISIRILIANVFLIIVSNMCMRENRRLSESAEKLTIDLKELVNEISINLTRADIEKNDAIRTDYSTGLMNEKAIFDEIKKLIISRKETSPLAIINLQFLKMSNHLAAYSISTQDEVLFELINKIKSSFHTKTIGRLSRFDFIIAVEVGPSEIEFSNNLKSIYSEFNKAIQVPPNLIPSLPQMGVAVWPSNTLSYKNVIRYAQVATLNSIENKMTEPVFFDEQMEMNLAQTTFLSAQIPTAITDRQFKVFYQPIIDLKTMRFTKAEALIRWDHPQKGLLLPSMFIPLVTNNQNISDLTELTINQVKADLLSIENEVSKDFKISINLSPHYLENRYENRNAIDFIKKVDFPKNKVILEISEEAILNTDSNMLQALNELKKLGIEIALDDFGTGYSSLSNLSVLPINYIKIDKSIINEIEQIPMNLKICKLITDLSHETGWKVVAEGVENQNQSNLLKEINIDLIQGYLYSKPLSFDELKSFLIGKT